MARLNVDLTDVPPDEGGGVIPDKTVLEFEVIEEELKPTKNGGQILLVTLEVCEDQKYAKRRIWLGMNVENASPVAQQIGQRELKALVLAATGKETIEDTEELLWNRFYAEVKVFKEKDRDGNDRERNGIRKYHLPEAMNPPPGKEQPARAERPAPSQRPAPSRPAQGGDRKVPWSAGGRPPAGGGRMNDAIDDDIPF